MSASLVDSGSNLSEKYLSSYSVALLLAVIRFYFVKAKQHLATETITKQVEV